MLTSKIHIHSGFYLLHTQGHLLLLSVSLQSVLLPVISKLVDNHPCPWTEPETWKQKMKATGVVPNEPLVTQAYPSLVVHNCPLPLRRPIMEDMWVASSEIQLIWVTLKVNEEPPSFWYSLRLWKVSLVLTNKKTAYKMKTSHTIWLTWRDDRGS